MSLEFEVFSRVSGFSYESAAIVDNFKSLIINDNFQDMNTFELVIAYSKENANLFVPEALIKLRGAFYYVDDVRISNLENNEFTVSGKSLFGKTYDRIIDGTYKVTDKPEKIAALIFKNNVADSAAVGRKFNYLTLPTINLFSSTAIKYQNSYGTVGDELKTLMQSYNFGVKEVSTAGVIENTVSFIQGHDYSSVIEISTEFENLLEVGYENSTTDFKSYAITLGEGEGSERVRIDYTLDGKTVTGIERRETYVDARDVQKTDSTTNVTMTDDEYEAALEVRANAKLMDQQRVLSLSGQLNIHDKLYQLGVDFGLGDTVTIRSLLFGVSNTAMITAIKYTYDNTGEYIEPTFGKQSPTVFDILKRK